MPEPLHVVVDHPLVKHKLFLMWRKETPTAEFGQLARELAQLFDTR